MTWYVKNNTETGVIEPYNGIDYHLIQCLSNYFNFTWKLLHANYVWGRFIDGQWTGIIGKVVNGTADMALGYLSSTPQRETVVDFTVPYFHTPITFLTPKYKMSSNLKTLILKPFNPVVWFILIGSLIGTSFCVSLFKKKSVLEIFWIILSIILRQNGNML